MNILIKIILFPYLFLLLIRGSWQALSITIYVCEHFFKMVKKVKKEGEPLITEIRFDNTRYKIWMGEYDHDLLTRLSELSEERNYWRRKALGVEDE
jgi:hypothetical protein